MLAQFILGPAGSGKTFRCLTEIRQALAAAADGPPLILIAPKQTTYQLERQLLASSAVAGYTRLHILSFERLAFFLFDRLEKTPPPMLDEEGRLMVLRSLLARKRDDLKLFRASARLTGFAQHLSEALRELQAQQLTPAALLELAERAQGVAGLRFKLQDLATLLREYLDWLESHALQDAEQLLGHAARALQQAAHPLALGRIWVDGFTDLTPAELALLRFLLPHTTGVTFTFCLDHPPEAHTTWLSHWSVARQAYGKCRQMTNAVLECEWSREMLPRRRDQGRFKGNPVLRHLEQHWSLPVPFSPREEDAPSLAESLRVASCVNPEAEAVLAAREIRRFVRAGGRYREVTVLTRDLAAYHDALGNTLTRYDIPFFLDRRESVAHHPLAELTRNALRTVAYGWQGDDWFAALKTGMVPAREEDIDHLENEALARGWRGDIWEQAITIPEQPAAAEALEKVRRQVIPPFARLAEALKQAGNRPNGTQLAQLLRQLWADLGVADTLERWSRQDTSPQPIHLTVWQQMGAWLDNVEMAFPTEPLGLREWLPILDAGLATLTVGVIPPALDQVLIGAIDRSRNPEIKLALVMGLNESVFPAPPKASALLTEHDRAELERQEIQLAGRNRNQLSRERHFGYLALTRARERLVLMYSQMDATGKALNPSPFLAAVRQLFPNLDIETVPRQLEWQEAEHPTELIAPLLRTQLAAEPTVAQTQTGARLARLPALTGLRGQLAHFHPPGESETLAPALAERLYGRDLRTSVSRMEQFAACPFRFFVHSGLRAEERELFELNIREQGNFQHDVLAKFHEQLGSEGKRWRDLTPAEARERIRVLAEAAALDFGEGLFQSGAQSRFTARVLIESLQDFVETLVGWMRQQYAFDPAAVELPFGDEAGGFPPWELALGGGHRLLLQGRIDRVDLHRGEAGESDAARCVVVDYKSSAKRLDPVLLEHGLQLQLPAYLNVLRHWPDPRPGFGVGRLLPAGVFYVNLRGKYGHETNRNEALADLPLARRLAYQHSGRFDASMLELLDCRPGAESGDQFAYRRKKDGTLSATSRESMDRDAFGALLDHVETALQKMGGAVYAGVVAVDPYRKGTTTACDLCDYRPVCRIDPWTHQYRVLRKSANAEPEGETTP